MKITKIILSIASISFIVGCATTSKRTLVSTKIENSEEKKIQSELIKREVKNTKTKPEVRKAFLEGVNLAEKAQSIADFDAAIAVFKQVVEMDPIFLEAYINLGWLLERRGNKEEAEKIYLTALSYDQNYKLAALALSNLYKSQGAYKKAITLLEDLKKQEKNSIPEIEYTLMGLYRLSGDYTTALALAQSKLEKNKNDIGALNNSALTYAKKGDYDLAVLVLKQIIALKPELAYAYNNLGVISLRQKKFDEAISYFNQAIAKDKSFLLAYRNLGALYLENNQYTKASQIFLRVTELNPYDFAAYNDLGLAYMGTREFTKARKVYEHLYEKEKNNAYIFKIAVSLNNEKSYEESRTYFEKYLKETGSMPSAEEGGLAYAQKARGYLERLEDMKKLKSLESQSATMGGVEGEKRGKEEILKDDELDLLDFNQDEKQTKLDEGPQQ